MKSPYAVISMAPKISCAHTHTLIYSNTYILSYTQILIFIGLFIIVIPILVIFLELTISTPGWFAVQEASATFWLSLATLGGLYVFHGRSKPWREGVDQRKYGDIYIFI